MAKKTKSKSTKTKKPLRSKDLAAKQAIETINNSSAEKLQGFISDDEGRVTVLDAWDDKMQTDHIFLFAGMPRNVKDFCDQHAISQARVIVIDSIADGDKLRGHKGELVCIGNYFNRSDRYQIFAMAKKAGFTLVDEFDWVAAREGQ